MTNLLPCPFCGDEAQLGTCWVGERQLGEQPAVRCLKCSARATMETWQDRSAPPSPAPSEGLDPKIRLLLEMMVAANGQVSATDDRYSLLNYFCDDRGQDTDTFNMAIGAGLIRTEFYSMCETSTAFLTAAGRAAVGGSRE